MERILVVEDNGKIQAHMVSLLRDEGYGTHGVTSAEDARAFLEDPNQWRPDLLLLDIRLPGKSGIEFIQEMGRDRLPPAIVISGEATISEALETLRMGVHDFIEKPFTDERFICSVKNCLEKMALRERVARLEQRLTQDQQLLGDAPATRDLLEQIRKVAPTNGRVLIRGESGTGKELVANTIHQLGARKDKPFVKINCAAFPVNLIEDELFGHMRGAFTDARQNKAGLFELANGGTLFMDEIGDMDYSLQARLLRVLEDGRVRRIGGTAEKQVDVRVLAATNRPLEEMVTKNEFREDLYYRLASLPIDVPPLRERGDDIPLLISYYLARFCKEHSIRPKDISAEAMAALGGYHWPGNIRELKNLCERLVVFAGDPITPDHLPAHILKQEPQDHRQPSGMIRIASLKPMPLKTFKTLCEKEYIETLLHRTNWNYIKVASDLHINRSYLHQKITSLGIDRK